MWPLLRTAVIAAVAALWLHEGPAYANDKLGYIKDRQEMAAARVEDQTVGIATQSAVGDLHFAVDLAAVLTDKQFRVLPLVVPGGAGNVDNLLHVEAPDAAIIQMDALARATLDENDDRIRYITKLYNAEFHLIARIGTAGIGALAGKRVGFGPEGGGTAITAKAVFAALDIEVEPVHLDTAQAIEQLRQGELEAVALVAGKPAPLLETLTPQDGLTLLSVPFGEKLVDDYLPASILNTDYPGLVGNGPRVETLAVGTVLAAFNWNPKNGRYHTLKWFTEAFFSNFEALASPPRHPKWADVNLAAEVPGWERFVPAAEWLENNPAPAKTATLKRSFSRFVTERAGNTGSTGNAERPAPMPKADQEALFREFVKWRRTEQQ